MSDLDIRNPERLSRVLDGFGPEQVLDSRERIEGLLFSRYVLVRYSSASALGRAQVGLHALLRVLEKESNDLVASEICDALGEIGDPVSCATLRKAAAVSASPLLRAEALLALVEVEGNEASRFLVERYRLERSRSVLATLGVALYALGDRRYKESVLKTLKSRDYKVRCRTVNLLVSFLANLPDWSLLPELEKALEAEDTKAVRCDLRRAIEAFSSSMEKSAQ